MSRHRLSLAESLLTVHGLAPIAAIAVFLAGIALWTIQQVLFWQRDPLVDPQMNIVSVAAIVFDFSVPGRGWWAIGVGAACFIAAVWISRLWPSDERRDARATWEWSDFANDDADD